MTHSIADFLDLPEDVRNGYWYIVTIDGQEFEYKAAKSFDCMYRHNPVFGSSNACFTLRGDAGNFACRMGRYLAGASHRSNPVIISREDAVKRAKAARFEDHRRL